MVIGSSHWLNYISECSFFVKMQHLWSRIGHLYFLLFVSLTIGLNGDVEVKETKRYRLNAFPLSWPEAREACLEANGTLAVAQTADDAFLLSALLGDNNISEAHVGFHDVFVEGTYVSLRGVPLDELGYNNGLQTMAMPGARCGRFVTNIGYQSVECYRPLPSVCQLLRGEVDEYQLVPGYGYYKRHKEELYWRAAISACRNEDANLIVVRSQAEYRAVAAHFSELVLYWNHYGGHHAFENRDFETIFGESLNNSGYSVWSLGYPGDWTNVESPCLAFTITSTNKNLGLGLGSATMPRGFICKRDLH